MKIVQEPNRLCRKIQNPVLLGVNHSQYGTEIIEIIFNTYMIFNLTVTPVSNNILPGIMSACVGKTDGYNYG